MDWVKREYGLGKARVLDKLGKARWVKREDGLSVKRMDWVKLASNEIG